MIEEESGRKERMTGDCTPGEGLRKDNDNDARRPGEAGEGPPDGLHFMRTGGNVVALKMG